MLVLIFVISTVSDQIAAYVGEDVILESEVRENMNFILSNDPAARQMFPSTDELRDYVLNELISHKLILLEAENESISVAKEEVESIVEQQIDQIKEAYPSEADFFKDLEQSNITLEELKQFRRKNVEAQLTMRRVVDKKIAAKIMISPIAVKTFYEENKDSIATRPSRVRLSHILLVIRPTESALKRGFEKALDVYKLLLVGGDFSVLAQEFSEDENSKYRGGMMGKVKRGEVLEEFEAAIFSLKPGVVSQPIPTRFGYHIVEILNKGSDWVLARQILIKVEVTKADTLRYEKLGKELAELVSSGADFDSLAKEYSSASEIDIGEYYVNQLSSPIDSIVNNLEEGQLSEAMLTPIGYSLIYLKEIIPEKPLAFEELRDKIAEYLYQQELQKYFTQLIEELKEKNFVRTFERQ